MRSSTRRVRSSAMFVCSSLARARRLIVTEAAPRGAPPQVVLVAGLLAHLEGLDDVALGDVAETESDTALEALPDLGDIVLLPAQRLDREVVGHDDAIAHQARLGVAADKTAAHLRACTVAELGGTAHLQNLGGTEQTLFELRLEHALERALHLVDRVVEI